MPKKKTSTKISLSADSVKINGPKVDGSYTLSFSVGEYEQGKIAKIMTIPQMTEIKLEVIANG